MIDFFYGILYDFSVNNVNSVKREFLFDWILICCMENLCYGGNNATKIIFDTPMCRICSGTCA